MCTFACRYRLGKHGIPCFSLVVRQARTRETRRQTERQVRNQKVREQKDSGDLLDHTLLFVSNSCLLLYKMFLLVKITRKPFFILFYYFTWCFAFPTVDLLFYLVQYKSRWEQVYCTRFLMVALVSGLVRNRLDTDYDLPTHAREPIHILHTTNQHYYLDVQHWFNQDPLQSSVHEPRHC